MSGDKTSNSGCSEELPIPVGMGNSHRPHANTSMESVVIRPIDDMQIELDGDYLESSPACLVAVIFELCIGMAKASLELTPIVQLEISS